MTTRTLARVRVVGDVSQHHMVRNIVVELPVGSKRFAQYCTLMYKCLMSTMTVSEARAALPEILDRVSAGDEVTLTRHGQAVAVIVRPDSLRSRRADAAQALATSVRDVLSAGRRTALAERPSMTAGRAEALVAEVRAARAQR